MKPKVINKPSKAKQPAKDKAVAPKFKLEARQPVLIEVKPQTETARIEREFLPHVDVFAQSLDVKFPRGVNVLVDLALAVLTCNEDICANKVETIRTLQKGVLLKRGGKQ